MNRAKLKSLVHHVIARSDPARLGSVRLNKILWYVDTLAYRTNGASLTGETYVKRQRGPVPQHILQVIGELEHENAIVVRKRERFGYTNTDFIAVTDADTSKLSQEEMELIEEVREVICDHHTADSISELSHNQIWEAANLGEEIPLSASLASTPAAVTDELLQWAESVRNRYEAVQQAA